MKCEVAFCSLALAIMMFLKVTDFALDLKQNEGFFCQAGVLFLFFLPYIFSRDQELHMSFKIKSNASKRTFGQGLLKNFNSMNIVYEFFSLAVKFDAFKFVFLCLLLKKQRENRRQEVYLDVIWLWLKHFLLENGGKIQNILVFEIKWRKNFICVVICPIRVSFSIRLPRKQRNTKSVFGSNSGKCFQYF